MKQTSLLPMTLGEQNPFLEGLDQDMMITDDFDMDGLEMPQLQLEA